MRKQYLVFFVLCLVGLYLIGLYLNGCKGKQEADVQERSGKPSSEVTSVIFDLSKVVPDIQGNIEGAEPTKASVNTSIHFGGWAADLQKKVPAKSIIVVADGKQIPFSPLMGVERKDVAEHYHSKDLLKSGWDGVLMAGTLGKGKHRLELYAVLDGGRLAHLNHKGEKSYVEIEVVD